MEARERGLVRPSWAKAPAWGEWEGMVEFVDAQARGELPAAFGGVRRLAGELGGGAEAWAMEVKGLEMDGYNVPALPAMVVVYGTNGVGGVHEMGHSAEVQDHRAVSDSLGLCRFHTYANPLAAQAELLAAVTGEPRSPGELAAVGERIWNLERSFLVREGFGLEDDRLPARSGADAFTQGPRAGAVLPPEAQIRMLAEYYRGRGWDEATAAPRPETLQRLGMGDVFERLEAG